MHAYPADGFLILTRFPETITKFPNGQKADYMCKFYENDYSNVRTAIGTGPTLVQDGKIVLDAETGWDDEKNTVILKLGDK